MCKRRVHVFLMSLQTHVKHCVCVCVTEGDYEEQRRHPEGQHAAQQVARHRTRRTGNADPIRVSDHPAAEPSEHQSGTKVRHKHTRTQITEQLTAL